MSRKAIAAVRKLKIELPPPTRNLLLTLASMADKRGDVVASQPALAQRSGLSITTVRRHSRLLASMELIAINPGRPLFEFARDDGSGPSPGWLAPTRYRLKRSLVR